MEDRLLLFAQQSALRNPRIEKKDVDYAAIGHGGMRIQLFQEMPFPVGFTE